MFDLNYYSYLIIILFLPLRKYFGYIEANMNHFLLEDGSIRYYDMEAYNLDYINNGKAFLYLYKQTGEEKYKQAVQLLRKQLDDHPRTSEGGFWHKKVYPNQMWLDGLYMRNISIILKKKKIMSM